MWGRKNYVELFTELMAAQYELVEGTLLTSSGLKLAFLIHLIQTCTFLQSTKLNAICSNDEAMELCCGYGKERKRVINFNKLS